MGKTSSKSNKKCGQYSYISVIILVSSLSIFLVIYAANAHWWQIESGSNKTVEYATLLFSMVAAAFGIYTFRTQLDDGNKTSNAQFLIELRKMFSTAERMEIHRIIQKENNEEEIKKYTPQKDEHSHEIYQDGREEQLDDYLGLFEFCKILIDKGSLSEEDFLTFYRYRLQNILVSDALMDKFEDEKSDWKKLFSLIVSLKNELEINEEIIKNEENKTEKIRAEKINKRINTINYLFPIPHPTCWRKIISKL